MITVKGFVKKLLLKIFNDAILTAALIDRMTHKSYVINMNGEFYRIKETKEWLNRTN